VERRPNNIGTTPGKQTEMQAMPLLNPNMNDDKSSIVFLFYSFVGSRSARNLTNLYKLYQIIFVRFETICPISVRKDTAVYH
jgi:hypothetical protein